MNIIDKILYNTNEYLDTFANEQLLDQTNRTYLPDVFQLFLKVYDKVAGDLSQKSQNLTNLNQDRIKFINECATLKQSLNLQYSDLQHQRNCVQGELYNKEMDLLQIEKRVNSIQMSGENFEQKLNDLVDGLHICQERNISLQEENDELNKHFNVQNTLNFNLKHLSLEIQKKNDEYDIALQQLEQQAQLLDQKLIKKLKIVSDFRQFIRTQRNDTTQQVQGGQQTQIRRAITGIKNPLRAVEDTQLLQESFQNFDSLAEQFEILAQDREFIGMENEIADNLGHIINLKTHLSTINVKEIESFSASSKKVERESFNSRHRTHHDLGRKKFKLDYKKVDSKLEMIKAFTEQSEEEDNQQFKPQGQGQEEMNHQQYYEENYIVETPRKPLLHHRHNNSQFESNRNLKEIRHIQSFNSFVSFDSRSSRNRLGAPTLRDELTVAMLQDTEQAELMTHREKYSQTSKKTQELGDLRFISSQFRENQTIKMVKTPKRRLESIALPQKQKPMFAQNLFKVGCSAMTLGVGVWLGYKLFIEQ